MENSDQHSILLKTNRNFKAEFYQTRRDSKFRQFYQRYSNLDSLFGENFPEKRVERIIRV